MCRGSVNRLDCCGFGRVVRKHSSQNRERFGSRAILRRKYVLKIFLDLGSIQLKHLIFALRVVAVIKNVPVIAHEAGQGLFESWIDEDFLESGDDLIEFEVFWGGGDI